MAMKNGWDLEPLNQQLQIFYYCSEINIGVAHDMIHSKLHSFLP